VRGEAGTAVAKKKTRPSAPAKRQGGKAAVKRPEFEDQVRIRMSSSFKEWVEQYADHRHLTMTDTLIQALIQDAKANGFEVPPPKR
jgi:hypothetical protein